MSRDHGRCHPSSTTTLLTPGTDSTASRTFSRSMPTPGHPMQGMHTCTSRAAVGVDFYVAQHSHPPKADGHVRIVHGLQCLDDVFFGR